MSTKEQCYLAYEQGRIAGKLYAELKKEYAEREMVKVVRSRWKYFRKQGIAVCMNCSFERNLDANFGRAISCPNCGARMDGE